MSDVRPQTGAPYELRVPRGVDPRVMFLFMGVGSLALGLFTTYLLIQGEFRMLALVLLALLGMACLSPRRGVYILTAFLPFMYFIRRSVLTYQEFSQKDPILVFPAITTIAMALGVFIFLAPQVFHYLRRSALIKATFLLMGVFIFEIVNPLQGNVLIGMAGVMYFIVPALWVVFGLIISDADVHRLLKLVLVIGCVTSIYGIYQHFFGLSDVEIYELKSKHFLKTFGSLSEARVMSTFSGLVDFARYLTVGGFIAFAFFWRNKRSLGLLLLLALQLYAMLFTASRTSFLVTLFSIVMLLILGAPDRRQIFVRGVMACVVILALYGFTYRQDARRAYNQQFSTNPFVVHTISGLTHPTQEATFQSRLSVWPMIVVNAVRAYPFGHGLGSTTPAATKFEGGQYYEADSYFFEIIYGSGLPAAILFAVLCVSLMRRLMRLCLDHPHEYLYRICYGIMAGVVLSSVFGVTARDNITGPFVWMLIGWVAKKDVDSSEAAAAGTRPAGA